jgi:hypothetical protein
MFPSSDGDSSFLRNVSTHLPNYMVSHLHGRGWRQQVPLIQDFPMKLHGITSKKVINFMC